MIRRRQAAVPEVAGCPDEQAFAFARTLAPFLTRSTTRCGRPEWDTAILKAAEYLGFPIVPRTAIYLIKRAFYRPPLGTIPFSDIFEPPKSLNGMEIWAVR